MIFYYRSLLVRRFFFSTLKIDEYHFLHEPIERAPQVPFGQSYECIASSNLPQEKLIKSTLPNPSIGITISSRASNSDILNYFKI